MRHYDLLSPAQDDILGLLGHLSDYSDKASDRFIDALTDAFEQLSVFPNMGRERGDLSENLRSFPIKRLKVTVFYYVTPEDGDAVLVARVLRQERDVDPSLFPDRS
ncbi:MAG: type II toxin-antitoxin system RelE/ParE family toxin [Bacteroidota bacterium]